MSDAKELMYQEDVGVVTEILPGAVKVEIQRGAGCKSCAMQGFCFSKNTPALFVLQTDLTLQVGDRVQMEISAQDRVLASLLIFVLPVVLLFLGFILARPFFPEVYAAITGFIFMGLSFLIIRYIDKKMGSKQSCRITAKLDYDANDDIANNEDTI
ncbi:MAG: SoxR reducing system RseC family protein [Candidatus Cloacimonadaceae bacterium]|nr:SoxR reducing system RseC family protein [Candidatus Cloacimonadaceae bacterium]